VNSSVGSNLGDPGFGFGAGGLSDYVAIWFGEDDEVGGFGDCSTVGFDNDLTSCDSLKCNHWRSEDGAAVVGRNDTPGDGDCSGLCAICEPSSGDVATAGSGCDWDGRVGNRHCCNVPGAGWGGSHDDCGGVLRRRRLC
jgi:hypothetical protein